MKDARTSRIKNFFILMVLNLYSVLDCYISLYTSLPLFSFHAVSMLPNMSIMWPIEFMLKYARACVLQVLLI